eukprot:CAMPEP_0170252710 /NCGR_PEP_ID=MMETSP0116_2-20130129/26191_1 /TAXON_ID=400756 /ORGANISM="Durinskia baltica, Strain CSIRO CS-38" /LENGTH=71 /DNA_ID=CAMNT_0010503685 /DNA_START=10 /DNA_END=225 /DNA_ORIENTATION=+
MTPPLYRSKGTQQGFRHREGGSVAMASDDVNMVDSRADFVDDEVEFDALLGKLVHVDYDKDFGDDFRDDDV